MDELQGIGMPSAGQYRSTINVPNPRDLEMTTLPEPGEAGDIGPKVPPPAPVIPKSESTSDVLNLTLHQCARNGDVKSAKILLSSMGGNIKKKINLEDEDDLTPIHYAARYNHLGVLKLLVDHNADINAKDEEGLTPLHYAARFKREGKKKSDEGLAEKQQLIEDLKSQVAQETAHRETLYTTKELYESDPSQGDLKKVIRSIQQSTEKINLLTAEFRQHQPASSEENINENGMHESDTTEDLAAQSSAIHFLINRGGDVNIRDIYGQTPLHYAAMRGNEVACKDLLSFNDKISVEATDKQGMTPLHMAASHKKVAVVRLLIESGVSLRCQDEENTTPLHAACTEGNVSIVKILFEAAAEQDGWVTIQRMVTDKDVDGNTCLSLAVENGHYDVVKMCLEKKADVNTPNNTYMYPLHQAAINGDVRIVRLLIEHNARIDVLNNEQATPLHKAAQYNHVQVVEFLVDREADIERKDDENYTPLLLAAVYGRAPTVDLLIQKGADVAALDKNDKTALFLAAEENQLSALEALLKYEEVKPLIGESDRYDNDPLHIAAMKGYLPIVRCLLKNDADADSKNEEEQTPLHLAAKFGRTNIVREFVNKDKSSVNDEDENSNTALHLAALAGHAKVAEVLIENGADVAARNVSLWTPLDCAAAKGWMKTARVLLEADSPIDPMDKAKTTPLHLAAKAGHMEVLQLLIDWDADVEQRDSDGNNCLDLAIDNNNEVTAEAIIKSNYWQEALRNHTLDLNTGRHDTPMRKLIRKMPDVAEAVFNRCMTDNKENLESKNYEITFNYEFLDDLYSIVNWSEKGSSESGSSSGSLYDADDKLTSKARPYTNDSGTFKKNHPLSIMVNAKREDLLAHPLVTALLRHKWSSFGRGFYYINFLIYAIYLVFITGYMLSTTAPQNNSSPCAQKLASNKSQPLFALIGKYAIIALAAWNLLREMLQIYQAKLNYLSWENLIEWITYITSLLLVIDFVDCQKDTGYRESWQWNVGVVAIFLAWINLVLFAQKFPRFGIYVVMFKDILKTFFQFFIVFMLFIIAFALAFHALLQNQDPFKTVWQSLIKTTVMMIGEFEYEGIFFPDDSGDDPEYKVMSYLLFCVFMVIMSIIIMNLLVGLAVDNIQEVQKQAELTRKAMQVELALDVERMVPDFIRRKFVVKKNMIQPNASVGVIFSRTFGLESYGLTAQNIGKALNPELDEIEKVLESQEKLQNTVNKMRYNNKEMRAQIMNLESMVKALLTAQGISYQDEDDQELDEISPLGVYS